ncbi:unnamed protein product [Thelazia callipaeda]|uniref:Dihydroorotate dehydrogenase (quinone), mitochondrial n=1 Tax=Thelazia callipaeda TaxID=103827 RepID=A0A0N5CNS8_THECL|nr:unnamed protein product [Thelazia callipaeda]
MPGAFEIELQPSPKQLRDFSWSVKLVSDCDSAIENLKPILVLTLHFVEGITKTFELTQEEVCEHFLILQKLHILLLQTFSIFKSAAIIVPSSLLLYGFVEYVTGNELFQQNQLMPLLNHAIKPSSLARLSLNLAKYRLLPPLGQSCVEYSELKCNVLGMELKNPLGLAAGFDKSKYMCILFLHFDDVNRLDYGEAINGLRKSGFGFIEIGTVTPLPQKKDSKSIKYSSDYEVVLNEVCLCFKGYISRGNFESAGLGMVHLFVKKAYDRNATVPLGVNIGRNEVNSSFKTDYSLGVDYFGPFSNYLVINFGSPNDIKKIADLQDVLKVNVGSLQRITLDGKIAPKVLIKIYPDLSESELKTIIKIALDKRYGIDGIIISNFTAYCGDNSGGAIKEDGFVSGKPLRDISTNCIRNVYRWSQGKIPIIGCGGISNGLAAYEKIRAGASLVQVYSSLLLQGFPVIGLIKRELVECLIRDGFNNVSEAVGADHRKE